jgi:hypothetical protein
MSAAGSAASPPQPERPPVQPMLDAAPLPHENDNTMCIHNKSGEIEGMQISLPLYEEPPPIGGTDYGRVGVVVR